MIGSLAICQWKGSMTCFVHWPPTPVQSWPRYTGEWWGEVQQTLLPQWTESWTIVFIWFQPFLHTLCARLLCALCVRACGVCLRVLFRLQMQLVTMTLVSSTLCWPWMTTAAHITCSSLIYPYHSLIVNCGHQHASRPIINLMTYTFICQSHLCEHWSMRIDHYCRMVEM